MSAVRTGTRLDQLRALRAAVDAEIELEQRRLTDQNAGKLSPRPRIHGARHDRIDQLLATLGATTQEIRRWALDNSYDVPTRGRLPVWVIEEYADHHEPIHRGAAP